MQRLPGWYKQRDNYFYPAWAYVFPTTVLRMPYSLTVAIVWSCIVYYPAGMAPEVSRYPRDNVVSSLTGCGSVAQAVSTAANLSLLALRCHRWHCGPAAWPYCQP